MTIEHTAPEPAVMPQPPDPGRFFADHYLPVMRLCLRHLRDETDAEDAVQEVFRRAVQCSAELHGDPLPWLITVARNVCRDELRRRRNGRTALERHAACTPTDDASACPDDPTLNPERVVVGELFVRELLGRLTPAERRVVAARVYDGASGADAAEALGLAGSTTRVLLARARQKLRRYLEDGQAAFAFIPVLGVRLTHALRRHLVERPWTGEAGAAMLLPAALLVTVAMAPGGVDAPITGGTPAPRLAIAGGTSTVEDARTTAANAAMAKASVSRALAPAPRPTSANAPEAPSSLLPPLKPDVDRTSVYDIEPSPNYSSDHTVFMLGASATCTTYCTQLFRSIDGGATWTYVGGAGLAGTSLILPPASFAQNTFYAWGPIGLQMTTDGGSTWLNVVPPVGGFAVAAPAWSGLGVLLSNNELWQLSGVTPQPYSLFQPGDSAAGPPLVLPGANGATEMLQPVISLDKQTHVLSCARICGASIALPFGGQRIQLIPSPNVSVDHTIFAVGYGGWLAVSHDLGQTFGPATPLSADQLVAVPHRDGVRLVALIAVGNTWAVEVSDDDGAKWTMATVDPALSLRNNAARIGSLASGRLIASMQRSDRLGYTGFACSTDGSAWTSCSTDSAR